MRGTALHTASAVILTIHPAPVDFGFKFKRIDLPDEPTIDAWVDNVKTVERSTTLGEGGVKVHTVEHVLSALAGMGIDNALIEMDANEPPIGDGSSLPFVELVKQAGVKEQELPRKEFTVHEPIHVETKSGSIMTIVPDTKFRVSCTNVGPEGRFTQYYSTEITPEIYEKELSRARTFVYYEDVKPLMDKGLIKGGSLENAVVIRGESILSKEPLRYQDEFVRHKILDIVGDLALFGRRIKGHVIAVRPGHGVNTEMARALQKQFASVSAMIPAVKIPKGGSVMDVNEIMTILPHRYPFLMVDRIVAFDGDTKCTGVKSVTINEPYFQGHFPSHPVMPGVLQLEAMAQVASVLVLYKTGNVGKVGYFMSADSVKWRKPVVPGDTVFIHVELKRTRKIGSKAVAHCVVNDEIVSQAEMTFGIIDV